MLIEQCSCVDRILYCVLRIVATFVSRVAAAAVGGSASGDARARGVRAARGGAGDGRGRARALVGGAVVAAERHLADGGGLARQAHGRHGQRLVPAHERDQPGRAARNQGAHHGPNTQLNHSSLFTRCRQLVFYWVFK